MDKSLGPNLEGQIRTIVKGTESLGLQKAGTSRTTLVVEFRLFMVRPCADCSQVLEPARAHPPKLQQNVASVAAISQQRTQRSWLERLSERELLVPLGRDLRN